jgi:hypothetical protein
MVKATKKYAENIEVYFIYNNIKKGLQYCKGQSDEIDLVIIAYGSTSERNNNIDCTIDLMGLQEKINDLVKEQIPVLAAVGDSVFSKPAYPSCLQNVLSVGASTLKDEIDPSISNINSQIDLFAP